MAVRIPRPIALTAVVAIVVTVSAVLIATLLRDDGETYLSDAAGSPPLTAVDSDPASLCGQHPCGVLTSLPVGPTTIELLADIDGGHGRLRVLGPATDVVLDTALAGMGVRLTQRSLACARVETSACLVRGGHDGGVVGEVFATGGDSWQAEQRPYFSDAGYLDLIMVSGTGSPEIAVAHHQGCAGTTAECAGAPVVVEVIALDGASLGCTPRYQSLQQLPGWPDVDIDEDDLADC